MKSIGVLGGGVSGLAISRHLASKGFNVSCFERSARFGGWVTSTRVDDGVLFEQGPHSLRPRAKGNGLRVVELVRELGLEHEALVSQGTERFVWAHGCMVRLPRSLKEVFTNPLTRRLPPRVALEALLYSYGAAKDVTIGEFISRKFGPNMKLLINAMVAGVFAGNADSLSLRTCFPDLLKYNAAGKGSLVRGMLFAPKEPPSESPAAKSHLVKASGVTFKEGMRRLTDVLESECRSKGVTMNANAPIQAISQHGSSWSIQSAAGGSSNEIDVLVSTLSPHALKAILPQSFTTAHSTLQDLIDRIGRVNVVVVNLCYAKNDVMLPRHGFGHLVAEVDEQIAHGVLGVIYDSNAFPEQQPEGYSVVSVMLGGAHAPWVGNLKEADWINLAMKAMSRHLKVGIKPLQAKAILHKDCIPQYKVGHSDAAAAARAELEKIGVVMLGTGVLGAGIADTVGGALNAVDANSLL